MEILKKIYFLKIARMGGGKIIKTEMGLIGVFLQIFFENLKPSKILPYYQLFIRENNYLIIAVFILCSHFPIVKRPFILLQF